MPIGLSIILIAAGAILTWAVTARTSGIDIHTVGVIPLIVGVVGLLLSIALWSSFGSWGPWRRGPDPSDRDPYERPRDPYDPRP